jgi:hypothetical protein
MNERVGLKTTTISQEDIAETLALYNALPSRNIVEIIDDDFNNCEIMGEAIGIVPDFYGRSMLQELNEEISSECVWLAIVWKDTKGNMYRDLLGVVDDPEALYEELSAKVAHQLPVITRLEEAHKQGLSRRRAEKKAS